MANQRDDAPDGAPPPDAEQAPESTPADDRATWLHTLLSKIEGREVEPAVTSPDAPEEHPTDVGSPAGDDEEVDVDIEVGGDTTRRTEREVVPLDGIVRRFSRRTCPGRARR